MSINGGEVAEILFDLRAISIELGLNKGIGL
jgi:hypothetical protein